MQNPYYRALYEYRRRRIYPARYAHILRAVFENKCRRLLEIGVFNGVHSRHMIQTASIFHASSDILYYGFDLFETYTEDMMKQELSERPSTMPMVQAKLEQTGAKVHLFKGDSKETVAREIPNIRQVDFAYIDGGHSVEAIDADWRNVRQLMGPQTIVLFDDYYHNTEPEMRGYGCQSLVHSLGDKEYRVRVLDPIDEFKKDWGVLKVSIAEVRLR